MTRQKLRELAQEARLAPCNHGCYDSHDGRNRNCYERRRAFNEMIKMLAHPDPVLALLDELDAAEQRVAGAIADYIADIDEDTVAMDTLASVIREGAWRQK